MKVKLLSVLALTLSISSLAFAQPNDTQAIEVEQNVYQNHMWAKSSFEYLIKKDIIKQEEITKDFIAGKISEREYLDWLSQALKVNDSEFLSWITDALKIAKDTPNIITREKMIHLTIRALQENGKLTKNEATIDPNRFSDLNLVSSEYFNTVALSVEKKLIVGRGNGDSAPTLSPKEETFRREAAVLLTRVLERISNSSL